MEFTVYSVVFTVHQLEGMATVSIHSSVAIRGTTIREQEGHLVSALWSQGDEVPKHVWILQDNKTELETLTLKAPPTFCSRRQFQI